MKQPLALIAERDAGLRGRLRDAFEARGFESVVAESLAEAEALLAARPVRVLIADPQARASTGRPLVEEARRRRPTPLVVGLIGSAADGGVAGEEACDDFVAREVDALGLERLGRRVAREVATRAELERLREGLRSREGFRGIVGRSVPMTRLRERIGELARDGSPVWIAGEAGSGRELVAREIHAQASPGSPFVPVDGRRLAAEPGAAGAVVREAAERARGGTLFLEEIAALGLEAQERVAEALHDRASEQAAARPIASARWTTAEGAESGRLAESLRGRFPGDDVVLPPLRERIDDLPLLAQHFVETIREINHLPEIRISAAAVETLRRYYWPGNVQELRNAVEHAVILCPGGVIGPEDLPERVREAERQAASAASGGAIDASRRFREAKAEVVGAFERVYLRALMERHRGNVTAAAHQAGMLRSALQRLLRKHGLKSSRFRLAPRAGAEEAWPRASG